MIRHRLLLLCLAALLQSACARQEAASFIINDDNRHSLSLMRTGYPWSDAWEVQLVTAHMPQCQRRHELKAVPEAKFKIELYQPQPGVFILHQGDHWYVTETGKCQFQQFASPPPAPGTLLGQFANKNGQFAFVDPAGKARVLPPLTR